MSNRKKHHRRMRDEIKLKAVLAEIDFQIANLQAIRESLVAYVLIQGWRSPITPKNSPATKSIPPQNRPK